MSEEPKGGFRITGIWILVLVVAGILILGDLNRRMAEARRLEQDAVLLETQVAVLATESVDLQYKVDNSSSEALVEAWAHADARMVREGEVLIIPLPPPDSTPAPDPGVEPIREQPSPFQVWLALLFGD